MKVNLKKLAVLEERLDYAERVFEDRPITHSLVKPIKELKELLKELSQDLAMCGECIVELDRPRLKAIAEKKKFTDLLDKADGP